MANTILDKNNIRLNVKVHSKEESIQLVGQILVDGGFVEQDYIEKMLEREKLVSTYMGNFLAIPHGTEDSKSLIKKSGIAVVQIPQGVDFGNGRLVKLLVGIAGKNNEHLDILSKIAIVCSELSNVEKLIEADSPEQILEMFDGGVM